MLFGGIVWTIFWRNPRKLSRRQLAAVNEIGEEGAIKRLSVRPFLLWLERFFISRESLWFDQDYIYVFRGQEFVAKYKFEQIAALESTKIWINSARIWRICFADEFEKTARASINLRQRLRFLRQILKSFCKFCTKNKDTIKTKPRFWETV